MAFVVDYLPAVFRFLFGAFGLLGIVGLIVAIVRNPDHSIFRSMITYSPLYLSCMAYFGILPVLEHNYFYSAGFSAVVFVLFAGLAGYLQSRRQA